MAEALRIAVFYDDAEQLDRAKSALTEAEVFEGVVEGYAAPDTLADLVDEGLVVDALPEHHEEVPEIAEPPPGPPPPEPSLVADLKQLAQQVELSGDDASRRLVLLDEGDEAAGDARIHPVVAAEAIEQEEGPAERVHYLCLRGPITQEQRLELDSFGVDIAAFEPPDRYRTFLTHEQRERASRLPYVRAIEPYRYEQVLTPALVDTMKEAEPGGPELLSDSGPESGVEFDCVMHRERDLPRVKALIENTEGLTVIGESNLRIRFRGPPAVPVLAAIAALPEVRRLGPHAPRRR